jgi:hypothetical protein
MKQPEDVQLSREEGEALLARLEANTLTAEDRKVLGKVLTFYFWLLFALREAKLSLKRVKALVFGEKPKPPKPPKPCNRPLRMLTRAQVRLVAGPTELPSATERATTGESATPPGHPPALASAP